MSIHDFSGIKGEGEAPTEEGTVLDLEDVLTALTQIREAIDMRREEDVDRWVLESLFGALAVLENTTNNMESLGEQGAALRKVRADLAATAIRAGTMINAMAAALLDGMEKEMAEDAIKAGGS